MKPLLSVLLPLILVSLSSAYIEGIFPNSGPTTGDTRVTIYSPEYQGLNSTDHPTPKCQFEDAEPLDASWIHCYGSATNPSPTRDQTCLNCQSPPRDAGKILVKVSIDGDFEDTEEIEFTYYIPPTVYYATPFLGYKTGGTFIQITGDNFADVPELRCSFGTVHVPATFVSETMITCKSPPSEVVDAAIPLRVSQNNQQYTRSSINYFYHSVPEISALIPNEGPITGGNEVFITGRQMSPFVTGDASFKNTSFVRFGPDHVSPAEIVNRTHIRTVAPPAVSPSPVAVEITFNNQEWTQNGILYYYYLSPYVTKLVPNLGVLEGNTNVTVIGANLYPTDETKCRFGDKVVDGHFINETAVWCITPPGDHAGIVDFGLAIEKNHFSAGKLIKYTYLKQPVLTAIAPSCGPTSGNTQLAVTGENFIYTGTDKVFCIFGTIRQPATVVSDTLIYCDTPNVLDKFGNNANDIHSLPFTLTLNNIDIIKSTLEFKYYTQPKLLDISPKIGPIEGNTLLTVSGSDFTGSCALVCRFATVEVQGTLISKNQVSCKSPTVPCTGDSIVQISLNGQQFTTNQYEDSQDTVFTNYQLPTVAYALPTSFPAGGNSSIGIYGNKFLLSKNSSVLQSGAHKFDYQCRFRSGTGNKTIIGVSTSSYFTDSYIHCKTPRLEEATDDVTLEISPDGQKWIEVPKQKLSFYNSPEISAIEPSFGRIKQQGKTLTATGRFLDCPETGCDNVKCSFSGENYQIVTQGTHKSSTEVVCEIPSLSRPDKTFVQVSMNGVDYTTQKLPYTFYDAFVINVDPAYIPVEGNTTVKVQGFGFADTPQLKVRLDDSKDNAVLLCNNKHCVFPAKFVSPSELTFQAPPQKSVNTADGESIGFRPIRVEVSIYGDVFTTNHVELNYYHQPEIGGSLASAGKAAFTFHTNTVSTIFVPIKITFPDNMRQEDFLRKARILCQYTVAAQVVTTEGKLVEYPYPTTKFDTNQANVQCPTPNLATPGTGSLSVALNGQSFVGNLPVTVLPQFKIETVGPRCGPKEGGTKVNLKVSGVQQNEYNSLFFSWSSVCTAPFTANLFNGDVLTTTTPPAPYQNTAGGSSLVVFTAEDKVNFQGNKTKSITRNHFETSADFLYYRRPVISRIYPHGGISTGGTPIFVEGAFFFSDAKYSCTPKCKFGDKLVDAEYISTVRIKCLSPPGPIGNYASLTVSLNGQDVAESVEPQGISFIGVPSISAISPTSGPSTGGTVVYLTGKDFVDMSKYPEEFTCSFTPIQSSEPAQIMPAFFVNSTTIACSTPGGWKAGMVTTVAVSFNGIDYSKDPIKFRFYLIERIFPLSGPAVGGTPVRIIGSGLIPENKKGHAACKFGASVATAITETDGEIVCQAPAAVQGPAYNGHVDFYYTLDGEKWEHYARNYNYYIQPEITSVVPRFISANGGKLKITGTDFDGNLADSLPTCRIDDTVVTAEKISSTELTCPFYNINYREGGDHFVQIALNNASFTDKNENNLISIYEVNDIQPKFGDADGGTQVIVTGKNFVSTNTPLCRFGVPGRTQVSVGTIVSPEKIACVVPAADIHAGGSTPWMVPFAVSFDTDDYDSFSKSGLHYYYYHEPQIENVEPRAAVIGESEIITVTASDESPFNRSIIGSNVVLTGLETDIVCRFGRFGSTSGALIAYNQISCPSPRAKVALEEDTSEEDVGLEISLNGQDFIDSDVSFKFVGSRNLISGSGSAMVMSLILGGVAVLFIMSVIKKKSSVNKEKEPLVAGIPKSDEIAPTQQRVIC